MDMNQIVVPLNELFPHLNCTVQMLKKPTKEYITEFCKAVLQHVYNEEIWKTTPEQHEICSGSSELLELIELQNLCKVFQHLCEKAKVRGNFNIIDLKKHNERRIQYYTRYIVNFILFHQLYQDEVITPCLIVIEEMRNEKRTLIKKIAQADSTIIEIKSNINKLQEEMSNSKNTELISHYNQLQLSKEHIMKDVKELSQKLKNINNLITEKEETLKDIENDIKKLEIQMYDDFEIYEKKYKKLVSTKDECDKKMAEFKQISDKQNKNIELHLILECMFKELSEKIDHLKQSSETERSLLTYQKNLEEIYQDLKKNYLSKEKTVAELTDKLASEKSLLINELHTVEENNAQVDENISKLEDKLSVQKQLLATSEENCNKLINSKINELNNKMEESKCIYAAYEARTDKLTEMLRNLERGKLF